MTVKTEVYGAVLQSILDGCGVFKRKVMESLSKKGITEVESDSWYPLDAMISTLMEFGPSVLLQIGKYVPKNAMFPPEIQTFHQAVMTIDVAYQMNHKHGAVGKYITDSQGEDILVRCDVPYPAQFNLGLIRGLASKFNANPKIEEISSDGGGVFKIRG